MEPESDIKTNQTLFYELLASARALVCVDFRIGSKKNEKCESGKKWNKILASLINNKTE